MKIKYFQDTDTLYIEFRKADVADTRDLAENTLLDINREGKICGITVELFGPPISNCDSGEDMPTGKRVQPTTG